MMNKSAHEDPQQADEAGPQGPPSKGAQVFAPVRHCDERVFERRSNLEDVCGFDPSDLQNRSHCSSPDCFVSRRLLPRNDDKRPTRHCDERVFDEVYPPLAGSNLDPDCSPEAIHARGSQSSLFTRREWLAGTSAAIGAGVLGHPAEGQALDAPKPNIVVIFADDLGYGDLGCYGAAKIKTPHLDQLAAEGMRFTDFYACAPVCTPSRCGLLTGRYPQRFGMERVLFPTSKNGIPDSEVLVSEVLKEQGYATACIGKWHLGHLPPYLPTRHGFDHYFGIPYSNDMHKPDGAPLMRGEEIIEQPVDQSTITRRYTEEAVQFILDHKDQPFFLYLPHSMPHIPLAVGTAFNGKSAGGLYGDVIEEIDWSVGEIVGALKELGIAEDTLVIFTSDNGPWLTYGPHGGGSGPLRMGKGSTFEGGMRVPCIAWWPNKIAAGQVHTEPAITLDFLPTFAALAGAQAPQDRVIDGRDIGGVLRGDGARGADEIFYFMTEELQALRVGDWKLKRAFDAKIYGEPVQHEALLFNLREDPGETKNLASAHPEIVERLEARMREWLVAGG